jgi:branched-chain amino acid transport system permease protein
MLIQVLISGLVIGCVYGLIALGYSLIYKASGLMSFAQGDMLTLGAFLGYMFYGQLKLPFVVSLVCVMLCMFGLGQLLERGIIRVLLKNNVLPVYIVLATIAISYIIQNAAMMIWGTQTLTFPPIFGSSLVELFGVKVQPEAIFCIIMSVICMLFLHVFMKYTRFGTAMRAAAMDPTAARACGINTSFSTGVTWGLSAGVAAVGGMLLGPIYGVFTMLGAIIGRKGFSSAVIGGFGNMYGAMLGGILLGLIETGTSAYVSSAYKDMISYSILLIFLFVKPTGIFNEQAITE